jgi:hypothetical protein
MKKILLSVLFMAFFSGLFSQSFTLQDTNGVAIAAGSTYQLLGNPTDVVMTAKIYVKNNAAVDKEVKVKKIINEGDTLPLTINYFCWGVCYAPWTYVSPFSQTIAAGQVTEQFYGDYNPQSVPGKTRVKYVWFDVNDVNDSVAVTVEFNASPESTGKELKLNSKLSDAYPNPAISKVSLDYYMPGSVKSATVVITNMLGSKVKEIALEDISGRIQIPVSDLVNGIYFYSLVADNQLIDTRKFVVRH